MENWENLSGKNNWEGLLEPLDHDLRSHIIHYGEMAEATYHAYDSDENLRTGCKYDKNDFFSQVGLGKGPAQKKYDITMFIYATASYAPFKRDTNWMGYVAVATDEGKLELGRRDIVVAWRGTKEGSEWTNNMLFFKRPPSKIFDDDHGYLSSYNLRKIFPSFSSDSLNLKVHAGFYEIYTSKNEKSRLCKMSAMEQVCQEISKLVEKYANETISVTVTGHSLGGALAILNAIDIEINVVKDWKYSSPRPRVTAFPFGCPQVGNSGFRDLVASINTNLHILRIENEPDIVPKLLRIGNKTERLIKRFQQMNITDNVHDLRLRDNLLKIVPGLCKITGYYKDVGQVLLMDTDKSWYLKGKKRLTKAALMAHDMEVYLHGVSGTQGGKHSNFIRNVERNIALLNKNGNYLKKGFGIPASWWNKADKANMVQMEDGSWDLKSGKRHLCSKLFKKVNPFH